MDKPLNEKKIDKFDKHKSWYKVDLDGAYITKYEVTTTVRKAKKIKIKKYKPPKKIIREVHVQKRESKPDCEFPRFFKCGIHICMSVLMAATAYCGYTYILPSSVILSNLTWISNGFFKEYQQE